MSSAEMHFDPQDVVPPEGGAFDAVVRTASPARIQPVVLDGARAWLKRAHRNPGPLRRMLQPLVTRLPIHLLAWIPQVEPGSVALQREGRRLVYLTRAGFPVPAVLASGPDWLVLEDCGQSARTIAATADRHVADALAAGVVDDLVLLHGAGLWHGGAQLKNTTVRAGKRFLIDFEDGFDAAMVTLEALQARDLFLLLLSLADGRDEAALAALARHYREQDGDASVVAHARRVTRPLASAVFRVLPGKDIRRAHAAARALQSVT